MDFVNFKQYCNSVTIIATTNISAQDSEPRLDCYILYLSTKTCVSGTSVVQIDVIDTTIPMCEQSLNEILSLTTIEANNEIVISLENTVVKCQTI